MKNTIKSGARLWVATDKGFFGPGAAELLTLVHRTGSVKQACTEMEMSYRKAFKIIDKIERELGCAVLFRQQGGKHGGCSSLTHTGKELLQRYKKFEAECGDFISDTCKKYFADLECYTNEDVKSRKPKA